jgi:hypothetical protein
MSLGFGTKLICASVLIFGMGTYLSPTYAQDELRISYNSAPICLSGICTAPKSNFTPGNRRVAGDCNEQCSITYNYCVANGNRNQCVEAFNRCSLRC